MLGAAGQLVCRKRGREAASRFFGRRFNGVSRSDEWASVGLVTQIQTVEATRDKYLTVSTAATTLEDDAVEPVASVLLPLPLAVFSGRGSRSTRSASLKLPLFTVGTVGRRELRGVAQRSWIGEANGENVDDDTPVGENIVDRTYDAHLRAACRWGEVAPTWWDLIESAPGCRNEKRMLRRNSSLTVSPIASYCSERIRKSSMMSNRTSRIKFCRPTSRWLDKVELSRDNRECTVEPEMLAAAIPVGIGNTAGDEIWAEWFVRIRSRRKRCWSLCRSRALSRWATTTGSVASASIRRRVRCLSASRARLCWEHWRGSLGIENTAGERGNREETEASSENARTGRRPCADQRRPNEQTHARCTHQKGNTWERVIDLPSASGRNNSDWRPKAGV